MRAIRITIVSCIVSLMSICSAAIAQDCTALEKIDLDKLTSYLGDTLPNDANAECITFAIKTIGRSRYEPAVKVLAKFLNFRRPPSALEKHYVLEHPPSVADMYPAAAALEEIGGVSPNAAAAVLEVIESSMSSVTARENAVCVWMELHKYKPSKGIRLLRQAALGASDPTVKENLQWALSRAPTWCDPKDKTRCKVAATIPRP